MPTKRQFDMVVIVVALSYAVRGLFNLWAAREASEGEGGYATRVAEATIGLEG